jgi:hypothetical protein
MLVWSVVNSFKYFDLLYTSCVEHVWDRSHKYQKDANFFCEIEAHVWFILRFTILTVPQ